MTRATGTIDEAQVEQFFADGPFTEAEIRASLVKLTRYLETGRVAATFGNKISDATVAEVVRRMRAML